MIYYFIFYRLESIG